MYAGQVSVGWLRCTIKYVLHGFLRVPLRFRLPSFSYLRCFLACSSPPPPVYLNRGRGLDVDYRAPRESLKTLLKVFFFFFFFFLVKRARVITFFEESNFGFRKKNDGWNIVS